MSEPATIGRYRIDVRLGRGSMGEVYRGWDPELERAVAIKTIRLDSPQFGDDIDEAITRFQTEAKSAGRLSHPNIVTVYDFGEEHGLYFLVMEFVEGETLARRLASGALPPGEAATVVLQACEALGAAHDAGIVHRDIKPGNLMVDNASGLVKIMDFGIAKLGVGDITRTGGVIGTPRYMSPEQVTGRPVDSRSDLFSLGVVYCETLTGEQVFDGSDMTAITYQIVHEDPKQLDEIENRLGEGPAWVLRRALAKEPERRFQTALEFRDAIETHCLGTGSAPTAASAAAEHEALEPASPEPAPPQPPADGTGESRPGLPADPVFSPPRRGRGPGGKLLLGFAVTVLVVGAAVVAWLRLGAGNWPGAPPTEDGAGTAADITAAPAAADSDRSGAAAVPPDTTPPPPPAQVRLTIAVEPSGAAVTVDDSLPGDSDSGIVLAVGAHRVHAEAAGYVPVDTLIELTSDDSVTAVALALARAPPTTGSVDVRASLRGRVLVAGRDRGAAPVTGLRLRPGTYTVRFVPEAGDALAEERAVTVRAGEASRVSFDIGDALLSVGVRQPRWATVYAGEVRLGDTPLIEHRLPARVYPVRVVREGYVTQERLVRLAPGDHFEWVNITLEPAGP